MYYELGWVPLDDARSGRGVVFPQGKSGVLDHSTSQDGGALELHPSIVKHGLKIVLGASFKNVMQILDQMDGTSGSDAI